MLSFREDLFSTRERIEDGGGAGSNPTGPQGNLALSLARYLKDKDFVVLHIHCRSAEGWGIPPRMRDTTSSVDYITFSLSQRATLSSLPLC
jgi:hypothetical protein